MCGLTSRLLSDPYDSFGGRVQVFIPEQVAYSKPDLERHMRTGDLTGPMAESGFKGHPQCR